jgi:predicted nucleic acid-binding protein
MQYLLDTNICIYLIKQKPPKVLARFQTLALSSVGISSITVAELEYGTCKSQQPERNRNALSGAENLLESQVEKTVTRENSILVSTCSRFLRAAAAEGGLL